MMSEIMEVPLPRACVKRLMSFLTFHISMFFSASLACCCSLMLAGLVLCEPWVQRLWGGLVSRNVQTLFPELRRGPRDGRTGAGRCSGRGGVVQDRWRGEIHATSTYRLCAESGWVKRGVRVDGVAVTRRVCGERKCVVLRPQRPPFSELRTSRHSLFPAFPRLCLLAKSRCNNNMSVILQESTHKDYLTRQILS
jgi:hypothetical protein